GGDDGFQIMGAERGGEAGPDDIVQPHFGGGGVAHGLHETLGVADLPHDVVLDYQVLLVPGKEFGRTGVVDPQPAVEPRGGLKERLHMQAGIGDGVDRTAELRDQHEFGLPHGKEGEVKKDESRYSERGGKILAITFRHDHSSSRKARCGVSSGADGAVTSTPSSSSSRCRRPLPGSTISFFLPGRSCSSVSR